MYRNLYFLLAGGAACLAVFFLAFNGSARSRADFAWINGTEPETLDVCKMTGQPEGDIAVALFEGLTVYHPQTLEPMPGVAHSWSVKGLTYTFHLRPDHWWIKEGAIFAPNGEKRNVTAADFMYSWKRHCLPETGSQYSFLLDSIAGIEEFKAETAKQWGEICDARKKAGQNLPLQVSELDDKERQKVEELRERIWNEKVGIKILDPLTLEVTLKAFIPYFLQVTSFYPLMPQPRESIEEHGESWILPRNIVTNGAYMLEEWRFNSYIRLKKNPHYWETAVFAADRLAKWNAQESPSPTEIAERDLLKEHGDLETHGMETLDAYAIEKEDISLNLYIHGDVDKVRQLPTSILSDLLEANRKQPIPHLHQALNPTIYYFDVNLKLSAFAAKDTGRKLRRALALAIDRNRLIGEISRGEQEPAFGMVADMIRGFNAEPRFGTGDFQRDVEEARRLIDEVKAAGVTLPRLRILYNTMEAHKSIAAFMQDQWRTHLGIEVKLENQEWQVYLNSRRSGQFDIARAGWIPDYNDPNTFLELFTSDDFDSDKNPERLDRPIVFNTQNHPNYNNPHYNRIVLRYAADLLSYLQDQKSTDAMLDDVKSWPFFGEAVGNMKRRNGKTSIEDLETALASYQSADTEEARFNYSSQARYLLFEIAEQMLMYDMPVLPIYFYRMTMLWPPELQGIHLNERDTHPPKFLRWQGGKRPTGHRYDAFPRLWPELKSPEAKESASR